MIHLDDATIPAPLDLLLAAKAIKDIMGPDGLVPRLLAYGRFPRFRGEHDHATQKKWRSSVSTVREVASLEASDAHVKRALRRHVNTSALMLIRRGDKERFLKENERQ